jgi:tetratricopeptide (TPR) repeat protein
VTLRFVHGQTSEGPRLVPLDEVVEVLPMVRLDALELHNDAPLDVQALVLLALVASETGERDEALAFPRKAAFLAPDDPYVTCVVADALDNAGKHAQAAARYRSAGRLVAALAPDDVLPCSEGLTAGQHDALLRARGQALPAAGEEAHR